MLFQSIQGVVLAILVLAFSGAVATNLGAILDLWSKVFRPRTIHVTSLLTGAPEEDGNILTIWNGSDKALLITRWDIVWAKRARFWSPVTDVAAEQDYDDVGTRIPPNDKANWIFREQNWFDWGARHYPLGTLYLRLSLVGKRNKLWFMLHKPPKPVSRS